MEKCVFDVKFEDLDGIIGDHAPFLITLSDGVREELRIVIDVISHTPPAVQCY